jgi:hypothetical protein
LGNGTGRHEVSPYDRAFIFGIAVNINIIIYKNLKGEKNSWLKK